MEECNKDKLKIVCIKKEPDGSLIYKCHNCKYKFKINNLELQVKKKVFDDIEKAVLSKIRIDEDRFYFWKEIFNPLKKKHLE